MALNTLNTGAISFKKLSGKVHTQQNFAVTEEGISTNVQQSYSTVFANPIVKLPVTASGMSGLYDTNGIVERVKFEIDIIPDTQIAVGRSQGYRLKLPSDYNTFGELFPEFSAGTYLHTALGKLQIVPPLYGTLKPDGSTEYDPILYQTNGSTVIAKFDPINWYIDLYSGIIFIQDPPAGYDSSAARPGYLEAFLYVGDYLDQVIASGITGTSTITASNGLNKVGDDIRLGGLLSGNTTISGLNGDTIDFSLENQGAFAVYVYSADTSSKYAGFGYGAGDIEHAVGDPTNDWIGKFGVSSDGWSIGKNVYLQAISAGTFTQLMMGIGKFEIASTVPNFSGASYANDYSANFGDRSLVDKAFVLAAIGTGSSNVTANNGLTKIGDNVVLGGDLTGNTTIGLPGYSLQFSGGSASGLYTYLGTDPTSQAVWTVQENSIQALVGNDLLNDSILDISPTGIGLYKTSGASPTILTVEKGKIRIGSEVPIFKGAEYDDDYSLNYGNRSLVDKAYVTGLTNSLNVTASNGLTKVGSDVRLGGTITGNTKVAIATGKTLTLSTGANSIIQITGSSTFNLTWDSTNQRLNVGTLNVVTGGTNNYTFGDHNQNKGTFGSAMFGEYSYIDTNVGAGFAVGESVWIRAYGGKAWGRGTRVNTGGIFGMIGGMYLPGSTDPKTNNKVPQVGGQGAFGYYNTNASQTDNHGALAQGSVILGGLNHNVPSNSTNSVVLGGDTIKATSATTNTVFMPKIRFGLGNSAAIVSNNSNTNILVRNSTTGEIEVRSASSLTGATSVTGTTSYIPYVNGSQNGFSYDSDLSFVQSTNRFKAGQNLSITTGGGTIDHATMLGVDHYISGNTGNIRWTTLMGEVNGITSTGSGIIGNSSILGGNSNVIKQSGANTVFNGMILGGAFNVIAATGNSINSAFSMGRFNEAHGTYSIAWGWRSKATGAHSIAFGSSKKVEDTTVPKVLASGLRAINISTNSSGQTAGHGARGSFSMILGGWDSDVPTGSTNSVVIGGQGIKVQNGVTNTVHLPKLRIGLGANASLVTNNANPNLLAFNSTTGEIEVRVASTVTGGTGTSSQNIYSAKRIVTGSTSLTGTDFVLFCNASGSITVTAPASPIDGQVYKIKDVSGNAGTNPITINGNGKNIDGSASIQINTNRGGIEMVYDQTLDFWSVMNFVG